jgi:carbon dioxide concentrating mechanism protein CcmN
MSLPPLQLRPISTSHYYVSGDVTIQDGAAIAPGVLLQADPNSRVIVKAGACIGIGAVLHAHQGTVEVGEGASIGAEVLLVGQVTIGARACVGSATTIFNSAIALGQVIPPGSLIGDHSRQAEVLQATDTVVYPAAEAAQNGTATTPAKAAPSPEPLQADNSATLAESSGVNVYGQMYVNQLLVKLFPNSQHTQAAATEPNQPFLEKSPWDD